MLDAIHNSHLSTNLSMMAYILKPGWLRQAALNMKLKYKYCASHNILSKMHYHQSSLTFIWYHMNTFVENVFINLYYGTRL